MDYIAPQGFWKNEKYTSLNLSENLKNLKSKKLKIVRTKMRCNTICDLTKMDTDENSAF